MMKFGKAMPSNHNGYVYWRRPLLRGYCALVQALLLIMYDTVYLLFYFVQEGPLCLFLCLRGKEQIQENHMAQVLTLLALEFN